MNDIGKLDRITDKLKEQLHATFWSKDPIDLLILNESMTLLNAEFECVKMREEARIKDEQTARREEVERRRLRNGSRGRWRP